MNDCVLTVKRILDLHKIPYTTEYLKDALLSHVDYPSLLAISDTLRKYKVENIGVKIEKQKLGEMPFPLVAEVLIDGIKEPYVLHSISAEEVNYYDNKGISRKSLKEDFFKIWTGVCVLIESSVDSKEIGIEERLASKKTMNVLKVILVLSLVSYAVIKFSKSVAITGDSGIIFTGLYFLLKILGLTTAIFLLWFEIDEYNPTLQSFCSGGKRTNCNAVLNSKYAKIFNGSLSLSVLGFAYFFGTLANLILMQFSETSLAFLSFLSFLTFPLILISLYYQAYVIRKWCKFCVMFQMVLLAEISIALFFGTYKNLNPSFEFLPLLLALFVIPLLSWKLVKPLLKNNKKVNLYRRALKKIKNNPNVLNGLLPKSRQIHTQPTGLGISFTNSNAKYNIVKVCNPYCGPCAKVHPIFDRLVSEGKINLQILFSVNTSDAARVKPIKHFLAIDEKENKAVMQNALDEWYYSKQKDYEAFTAKYPMNGELMQQDDKIIAMRNWCIDENITHTPTIFINGYELPRVYNIDDLKDVLS